MDLGKRKRSKCPVCGGTDSLGRGFVNPRQHIVGHAKRELLEQYLGNKVDAKHAKYVKKNLVVVNVTSFQLKI